MPFSLIPDRVYDSIYAIPLKDLKKRGITLLLADLDNTLARYGQTDPEPQLLAWRESLRGAGIELFLLSNSRKPARVANYAGALGIPVLGNVGKPKTDGYHSAMARMGRAPAQTAMVGDQIFTDILGARRASVLAILVEPIKLAGNPGRYLRYAVETPFRALGRKRGG